MEMLNVAPEQRPPLMEKTLARLMRNHGKQKPVHQKSKAPFGEHAMDPRHGEDVNLPSVRLCPPGASISTASITVETPLLAKTASPHKNVPGCTKKPTEKTYQAWISEVLVDGRGVVASLPRETAVSLNSVCASGHSFWWLWNLRHTDYETHRTYRTDVLNSVYAQSSMDSTAWLPSSTNYASGVDLFDSVVSLGVSVTVNELDYNATPSASFVDQMSTVGPRVLMELETASKGLSPAMLGTFLVFDDDDYGSTGPLSSFAKYEYDSSVEFMDKNQRSKRILASVSVSQFHSYRFSDMLHAFNTLGPEHNRNLAHNNLYEFSSVLLERVHELAKMGYVKMNMVPDTVVGVPHVTISPDNEDEWQMTGYSYMSAETREDVFEGMPMFTDFDPRFAKRVVSKPEYSADACFAAMSLVLLASTRAQFGQAYLPLYRKAMGLDSKGARVTPVPDNSLPSVILKIREGGQTEAFAEILRGMRPTYLRKLDRNLKDVFDQIADDFVETVRSDVVVKRKKGSPPALFDTNKTVFSKIILYLTKSTDTFTPLFAPVSSPEMEADREQTRIDRSRLLSVVAHQKDRWLLRSPRRVGAGLEV